MGLKNGKYDFSVLTTWKLYILMSPMNKQIAWLAKLFLLEPFFPVRSHDTLFHAMLLFSKHQRLNVIPVVESVNSSVDGFVTQVSTIYLPFVAISSFEGRIGYETNCQ
jgi:hypothetical protein